MHVLYHALVSQCWSCIIIIYFTLVRMCRGGHRSHYLLACMVVLPVTVMGQLSTMQLRYKPVRPDSIAIKLACVTLKLCMHSLLWMGLHEYYSIQLENILQLCSSLTCQKYYYTIIITLYMLHDTWSQGCMIHDNITHFVSETKKYVRGHLRFENPWHVYSHV